MKLLRSWPARVPEGRNYVVDGVEKLVIDRFTYEKLFDIDDDVVMLEWDIAIDPEDLDRFVTTARENPEDVVVAPYRLRFDHRPWLWVHRYDTNIHVQEGDPDCHWWGLGLTYLPRDIIRHFQVALEREPWGVEGFNDCTLSMWHWATVKKPAPILWDVRPVHLHYENPVL